MLSRRRLLWGLPVLLVVAAVAYTAWLGWQVEEDLSDAQSSVTRLQTALQDDDSSARDGAIARLQDASADAQSHTSGAWWGGLTHLPIVGDDATGIRALSRSLATVADGGVEPLATSVGGLDGLTSGGRVDLKVVGKMAAPLTQASTAFASADADVAGLDSSGYAGAFRSRFEKYVDLVGRAASGLASAQKATEVLPTMLGSDGPRDYLLIFQNNAEIRATGGMPGAWALVHADEGKLSLTKQGTAGDFPTTDEPILPLSEGELAVYDKPLGQYWQDAGFTPDFPRAAQLWNARWDVKFPQIPLDGVLAVDPVGLSYLLDGTGPVQVGDTSLTSDNLVEELLSKPYLNLRPTAQDELFAEAANTIFEASTGDLASPVKFVQGVNRAASEGRLLLSAADPRVRHVLSGTRVEGALSGDDGSIPHVDIGLNDATGSKMSYYLRYWADVRATACASGIQKISGSLTLSQSIAAVDAAQLPDSVNGAGAFGTDPGSQLVLVRVYGPFGGSIDHVSLNGRSLDKNLETVQLDGRPVATVDALLSDKDALLSWTMSTGAGQTGAVEVGMTPSVVKGDNDAVSASSC